MDVSLKVTDQPQESSFFDLVSGDNVLSIPLFQRQYRWSQRNLDWLLDDILDISSLARRLPQVSTPQMIQQGFGWHTRQLGAATLAIRTGC